MEKEKIKKFLEDNNFLPISRPHWEFFVLSHGDRSKKERNIKKIKGNVKKKRGLYAYKKDGKLLYVGKAKSLFGRIKSHYIESFEEVKGDTKEKSRYGANLWHRFFEKHSGEVEIYWQELEDEKERQIIEKMIQYFKDEDIEFEKFREKAKREKQTTPRSARVLGGVSF